jgi:hypothetical protein
MLKLKQQFLIEDKELDLLPKKPQNLDLEDEGGWPLKHL